VDEFLVLSADGIARLLFFDRQPRDRDQPIEEYSVKVTAPNLSAEASVYAGYAHSHPAPLFAEMAARWRGWERELEWESLESELSLQCRHDRRGHIRIAVRLGSRMGAWEFSWEVKAAVMAEGGQLDRLAGDAAGFFGRSRSTER
jgi:hypothetical protein